MSLLPPLRTLLAIKTMGQGTRSLSERVESVKNSHLRLKIRTDDSDSITGFYQNFGETEPFIGLYYQKNKTS